MCRLKCNASFSRLTIPVEPETKRQKPASEDKKEFNFIKKKLFYKNYET